MRWNCPHCGTALAITDDKIGTGWAFSRCYKCAGHAMVRRPEVNLIKVDRAPVGEQVLLPEAFEENFLSAKSAESLQKKNVRSSVFADFERTRALSHAGDDFDRPPLPSSPGSRAPSRVPERPANYASSGRQVPLTDGAMAAGPQLPASHSLSLGKHPGFDDPVEPPKMTHAPQTTKAATPLSMEPKAPAPQALPDFPEPLPEVPVSSTSNRLLPIAFGLAGAVTVASGAYLYVQAQSILQRPSSTSSDRRIQRTALERPAPQEQPAHETAITQSAAAPVMAPLPEPDRRPAVEREVPADTVKENSAPQAPGSPPLMVKPKGKNVSLYKGPGTQFPAIGIANESAKYVVTDWNDRWFKVMIATGQSGEAQDYAWIRTDTVKVLINTQQ